MAPPNDNETQGISQETIDLTNRQTEANNNYSESNKNAAYSNNLLNKSILESFNSLNSFNSVVEGGNNMMSSLSRRILGTENVFRGLSQATENQIKTFHYFNAGVLKATNAFNSLNNVDLSQFNSIGNQLNNIIETSGTLGDAVQKVGNIVGGNIPAAATQSIEALKGFAKNFSDNADKAKRFEIALLQSHAQTGRFSEIIKSSGQNFENLGNIMTNTNAELSALGKQTGLSHEQVSRFYFQLGKIPGALDEVVSSSMHGQSSISMLKATLSVAAGTGRNTEEVMQDLAKAFDDFGLSGQAALTQVARISDVMGKLGTSSQDTRHAFQTINDSMLLLGDQTEGTTKIIDNFFKSFKEGAGLSAKQSLNLITQMTTQIGNLNVAQKAFLSAQTGGPGGLMGAFQIEKELKEGKIDKVFDRVRQTLQKQFGKIVTIDEASQSQQAAAMFQKQRTLLTSGAFGGIAKNEAEASKILEALKTGAKPGQLGIEADKDQNLIRTIETGHEYQKRQVSTTNEMALSLDEIALNSAITAKSLLETSITAAKPATGFQINKETQETKARLDQALSESLKSSVARQESRKNKTEATDQLKQLTVENAKSTFGSEGELSIPNYLKKSVSGMFSTLSSGDARFKESTDQKRKNLAIQIAEDKQKRDYDFISSKKPEELTEQEKNLKSFKEMIDKARKNINDDFVNKTKNIKDPKKIEELKNEKQTKLNTINEFMLKPDDEKVKELENLKNKYHSVFQNELGQVIQNKSLKPEILNKNLPKTMTNEMVKKEMLQPQASQPKLNALQETKRVSEATEASKEDRRKIVLETEPATLNIKVDVNNDGKTTTSMHQASVNAAQQ